MVDRRFGRGVSAHIGTGVDARHRRNIDDRSVARCFHVRDGELTKAPCAEYIDVVHTFEVGEGYFEWVLAPAAADTDIVDQDVEFAEYIERPFNQVLELFLFADVACDGYGATAGRLNLVGDLLCVVLFHICDDYVCPCLCQYPGAGASDAVTASRDDGHFAG